jgi:hypothetical protein
MLQDKHVFFKDNLRLYSSPTLADSLSAYPHQSASRWAVLHINLRGAIRADDEKSGLVLSSWKLVSEPNSKHPILTPV